MSKLHLFCQLPVTPDGLICPVHADSLADAIIEAEKSGVRLERDLNTTDQFTDQRGSRFLLVTDPEQLARLMQPRFQLGQLMMTPGASEALQRTHQSPIDFLNRHVIGDWGLVCEDDRKENELSLREGFRLMSIYELKDRTRIWVITEADRSVTTFLLPDEY